MKHALQQAAVLLLLTLAVACDTTVHVRLSSGNDPAMSQECGLVAAKMGSFYLELVREGDGQELIFKKCIDLPGGAEQPTSLTELEELLAGRIVFEDVPPGDEWTVWVEGFSAAQCAKSGAPLLCGVENGLKIPPSSGEIEIEVACVAPRYFTWSSEALQRTCRVK